MVEYFIIRRLLERRFAMRNASEESICRNVVLFDG